MNPPVAGHSRSPRRTDSTEPATVLIYFSPIGVGKAADADACTHQLLGTGVLPPSRLDDRRLLPAEFRRTMYPRLQDILRLGSIIL